MPTYEYLCDDCGHNFEKFQSITADAIRKCPVCGRNKVRRLIGTGAGLIFKGSGFYQTDYRSETYKKDAKDEKDEISSGKSEDSKSSETGNKKTAKSKGDL